MAKKQDKETKTPEIREQQEAVEAPKRKARMPRASNAASQNTETERFNAPDITVVAPLTGKEDGSDRPKRRARAKISNESPASAPGGAQPEAAGTEDTPAKRHARKSAGLPAENPPSISEGGQSEIGKDDDVFAAVRLSRPRGKMVKVARHDGERSQKISEFRAQIPASDETETQPFVAKPLAGNIPPWMRQPRMQVGFYEKALLDAKVVRAAGNRLNRETLEARAAALKNTVLSSISNRAVCLMDAQAPVVLEPMAYERVGRLVTLLGHSDIRDAFERDFIAYCRKVFLPWHVLVSAQSPDPVLQNLENGGMQDQNGGGEELADPAIEGIFSIFEREIGRFESSAMERSQIEQGHIDHHASCVTELLCDWARSLKYIDAGAMGGSEKRLLSEAFVDYFEKILKSNTAAARMQNVELPDNRLRQRFGLDAMDMAILWMLIGIEIDPRFRNELSENWNQQTVVFLSTGTFMRFFGADARLRSDLLRRLSPSGRLSSKGLIRIMPNATPTQSLYYEIIGSEQVRYLFTGVKSLSLASTVYAELVSPNLPEDTYIAPVHQKTLSIIQNYRERPLISDAADYASDNLNFVPSMAFLVEGLPGSGRMTLVKIIASKLSMPVIVVQCNPMAAIHPTDYEDYLKAVFCDASMMQAILCLRDSGTLLTDERLSAALARQLARFPVVCAFCVDLAVKTLPVIDPYLTFKARMDANLRDNAVAIWASHLHLPGLNRDAIDVLMLSQSMALQPFQIQKAAKLAYYSAEAGNDAKIVLNNDMLERAAAVQVTKNIGNLAFVSDPEITLDDVIVSDDIMQKIQQIIGSALNRRRVLYDWGLSRRIRRGTGVIALFDGDPGTGKTHSAEAIAKALGLSLMRINIATMVDKYIGETEKNLTTIFEQARPDMQLLLFDEADSLFTKRTANVSKSNDRYSNMSVNVLLQLVERYEGVSILTTNLKNAIDPAFERRITYKVYFPMPKKPERERLWRYMCPPEIRTSEPIDYEWLSELEMSGGEIKNAVLTAAFQAATRGVLLNSEILYDAGVSEASAAGRVMRRYDENSDDMFS